MILFLFGFLLCLSLFLVLFIILFFKKIIYFNFYHKKDSDFTNFIDTDFYDDSYSSLRKMLK